jgi:hypothetical protein
MKMKDIYKSWDFEKFVTFIMYHSAMADFNLAPEEKDIIIKRTGLDEFQELRAFHKQNSDYENIQVILYFKEKFLDDKEQLKPVYDSINKIFNADGEYSYFEKNMMRAFQLLLR